MFNVKIFFLLKKFSYGLFVFLMGWEIIVSFVSYRLSDCKSMCCFVMHIA